jgi:hypothetical protein
MSKGNMTQWTKRFQSVEKRFTQKIVLHWKESTQALHSNSEEDDITNNLVHRLCKDPAVRRIGWPEAQYVPFEPIGNADAITGKGYIDLAVILDQNRDMYLAYECKRLNVVHGGKKSSLATVYVTEGLQRFVTQQYSRYLPMGCMLGYVMDGKIPYAKQKVEASIKNNSASGSLKSGPTDIKDIGISKRFHTSHVRYDGSNFDVNHTLLPI